MAVAFNNVLDKFFIGVVQSARADLLLVSFIQLFMNEVSKYRYCWPEVPVVGGRTKDQIFCETLTLEKKGKYITSPDIKTTGKRFGPCRDNLFATKRKCYVTHDLQYFCHPFKTDWNNRRFSLKKELCGNLLGCAGFFAYCLVQ